MTRSCPGADQVALLLPLWPHPLGLMAHLAGVGIAELQAYVGEKGALSPSECQAVRDAFGLRQSAHRLKDGETDYEPGSFYLLLAEAPPKQVLRAYDQLSDGGDLEFSAEVEPASGSPNPDWRFLLFWTYGYRYVLLCFRRGTRQAAALDAPEDWINRSSKPVTVSSRLYGAMVRLRERASGFEVNSMDGMHRLVRTHRAELDQLASGRHGITELSEPLIVEGLSNRTWDD